MDLQAKIEAYLAGELKGKALKDFESMLQQDEALSQQILDQHFGDSEKIDAYVQGSMSEEEKLKFEHKMAIDSELASQVELQRALIFSIKHQDEINKLKDVVGKLKQAPGPSFEVIKGEKEIPKTTKPSQLQPMYYLGIAASFVGILILLYFWTNPNEINYTQLAQKNTQTLSFFSTEAYTKELKIAAGPTNNYEDLWQEAVGLYKKGELTQAEASFLKLKDSPFYRKNAMLFRGNIFLLQGAYEAAVEELDYILKDESDFLENDIVKQAAYWNAAVAHVGLSNPEQAKTFLSSLAELQESNWKQQALDLLAKIHP